MTVENAIRLRTDLRATASFLYGLSNAIASNEELASLVARCVNTDANDITAACNQGAYSCNQLADIYDASLKAVDVQLPPGMN